MCVDWLLDLCVLLLAGVILHTVPYIKMNRTGFAKGAATILVTSRYEWKLLSLTLLKFAGLF